MFLKLPVLVVKDEDPYDLCVNSERVMWFTPMQDGDDDFTRLYMNVAGNNGEPAQLDIAMPYDEVVELFNSAEQKRGEDHEES
jgi:hypothetical protein